MKHLEFKFNVIDINKVC